ncbi:MAG: carbonic anhydrase [Flavobacteriales bacterium]|nr:carbonic anhydrase [Flavobacteriales bacterium]
MRPIHFLVLPALLLAACTRPGEATPARAPSTPDEVLRMLRAGNERFHDFHAIHPDQGPERIKELLGGQHPWAVVISCSDSRVVPELVFDQGLGDLFTVRTAGNVVGEYELASVEYAVEHLGAPLVIVMGHTHCGAINAYLNESEHPCNGHMKQLVAYLEAESEQQEASVDGLTIDEATRANIAHGVQEIEWLFREIEEGGNPMHAKVVGAVYHIEDGHVEWL